MVKADLTRDYYGDLDLQPGADVADIKKQFKKLALTYHPDRNPGRENEVTAKFQRIQSAHEVLTDPQERLKYDNNRQRASTRFGTAYAGGSGVRGNPWADAGSNFPPPPKHPTARQAPQRPSAGAERYRKFDPPRQSAHQTAHEGAGARQKTYEAWENMKQKPASKRPGNAPPPPPRNTPQSGQPESSTRTQPAPTRPRPNYDEFRQDSTPGSSPHRRSQSTNTSSRRGFMPNTPGGDEPAAPMGAYFTQHYKPSKAPDLPARDPAPTQPPPRPPKEPFQPAQNVNPDPLKQFRESTMRSPTEPRVSTPYATHGGEKLDPFESASIHRSKSTREPSQRYDANGHMPRTGSDPNLSSPHRSKSFVDRGPSSRRTHHAVPSVEVESDSSDDGPQMGGRPFGKPRVRKATNGTHIPDTTKRPESQHGPPLRTSQGQSQPQANGEPSIFSFSINNDTFQPTKANARKQGFSSSAENISTKFSTEDWDGKFAAGTNYFVPEQGNGNTSRPRAQSGSRSRGRSPVKARPIDPFHAQPKNGESEPIVESPGGTKFSAKEWADTFKPQTFAPPPMPTPSRQVPTRKRTGPTLRPTLGGNAAVVDDGETSDEKPLFPSSRAPPTPAAQSPDAMDVDTPPVMNTVPQFQAKTAENRNVNASSPKRAAASSPTDESTLKVNFDDLKIQDLLSSLDLPSAPMPPQLPELPQGGRLSEVAYEDYSLRFAKYMTSWDLYNKQFMLHLIARKNQNDKLGTKRWLDDQGLELYRRGLKEDGIVLSRWAVEKDRHESTIRDWIVLREKMKSVGATRSPRKKTH